MRIFSEQTHGDFTGRLPPLGGDGEHDVSGAGIPIYKYLGRRAVFARLVQCRQYRLVEAVICAVAGILDPRARSRIIDARIPGGQYVVSERIFTIRNSLRKCGCPIIPVTVEGHAQSIGQMAGLRTWQAPEA